MDNIRQLVLDDKLAEAVKIVRNTHNLGLHAAKDWIENKYAMERKIVKDRRLYEQISFLEDWVEENNVNNRKWYWALKGVIEYAKQQFGV